MNATYKPILDLIFFKVKSTVDQQVWVKEIADMLKNISKFLT